MKLSDRQLLAGVGLLALAIVVTVTTVLVAAIGRGGAPSVLRGEAIHVTSDLSPHTQLFGDTAAATHAFLWEARTGMQDLGTLGFASVATDGNARGQIVGWSDTAVPGPTHAFLWEVGADMQDLGTLGGIDGVAYVNSTAYGINARGQIVGVSLTANWEIGHAVLWDPGRSKGTKGRQEDED